MTTHLEPDTLDCKVKWALGNITSNKASENYGIPAELFQILKADAVKVLHSICQQIWKAQQWPQDWKRSVLFQSQKRAMPKNVQTTTQLCSFSNARKITLKILQASLQQYVNEKLPDAKSGFIQGRGTRDQIANINWIIEKAREFQKTSTSAVLITPKSLTV